MVETAARRRGLSLLELILALALSGMILYACSMAIDLHLRTLDARRLNLEEAQLARSVLNMIATDLRSTLRYEPVDMSAIEQMAMEAMSSAMAGAGNQSGEGSGGEGGGGPMGPGGGGPPGGDGQGGGRGQETGQGSGGSSAPPPGGQGGQGGAGGAGGSGGRGGTGGTGTSGGASGGTGGSSFSTESETPAEESEYTGDLANATQLPPVIGLYGNATQIQIDVSRLPRVDEYQTVISPQDPSLAAIPSDVKTVSYFLQSSLSGTGSVRDPLADSAPLGQAPAQGLVRRQVDRSVAQFAILNGQTDALMRTGELIAGEVTGLEFQYFDGTTWLPTWDSQQFGGLPLAVGVTIAITPQHTVGTSLTQANLAAPGGEAMIYRTVIPLPLGELPKTAEDAATSEGMENLGL